MGLAQKISKKPEPYSTSKVQADCPQRSQANTKAPAVETGLANSKARSLAKDTHHQGDARSVVLLKVLEVLLLQAIPHCNRRFTH